MTFRKNKNNNLETSIEHQNQSYEKNQAQSYPKQKRNHQIQKYDETEDDEAFEYGYKKDKR